MSVSTRWHPSGANDHHGPPPVGRLLAREHAVWRVQQVVDVPLSDDDREIWLQASMPDLHAWRGRPYRIHVQFVAGARPSWARDEVTPLAKLDVPAGFVGMSWRLYPASDRWPSCSCCGEPVPCRAELQDREVEAGLAQVEKLVQRLPGSCWGCGEPITRRQHVVVYPGENLDLPGGPEVRFHTRRRCAYTAQRYELSWIAVDPRRERILTWPQCPGILIVHADGSSECRSGAGPVGTDHVGEPGCAGHLTHDHGCQAACYVGGGWYSSPSEMDGCPRGCSREGHPGTRTTPRPARRPFAVEQLPEPADDRSALRLDEQPL